MEEFEVKQVEGRPAWIEIKQGDRIIVLHYWQIDELNEKIQEIRDNEN